MIHARFTTKMLAILKKMKGADLICYSASEISSFKTVYDGVIYLQTSSGTIKIFNKEIQIPWFKH